MSFFTPRIVSANTWENTMATLAGVLNRQKFVTEGTYIFTNWEPEFNWNGMTVTIPRVYKARIQTLGKISFISLQFGATLAAPLANTIGVNLPVTAPLLESGTSQCLAVRYSIGGTDEMGQAILNDGTNQLLLRRAPVANFTAAAIYVQLCQGFIEVA